MPRSVRLVTVAALVAGCLVLVACDGGPPQGARGGSGGSRGAAGVGDPYFPKAGNGGYDVTHYGLTLSYVPDGDRLRGTAVITARATQDLSTFDLDLLGMDVEEVRVGGAVARFRREGQELVVRPSEALVGGAAFEVRVRYGGSPVTITDADRSQEGWLRTADGVLALGEPTGSMAWFPGAHHPSDKASYDVAVTVPKGLTAVSNGEPRGRRTGPDGRTTFRWHTAEPMASYAATLAIGRFTVTTSVLGDGLPAYVAVDPSQVAASRAVLARLPEVMDWARDSFGPYPFSSVGAIVDRPGDAGYALETQNRPVFPGAPGMETFVHELAHQWFGVSVTPRSWRDMWLSEGLATYAEWLWTEDEGGATAEETFRALYDHGADVYEDLWDFPPAKPPGPAHISDAPVYQRGAMVVHRVRQALHDDGAFHDLLRGWAAARRHGNARTEDFTAFVEKRAPQVDFDGIWSQWLYGEGRPPRP